TTFSLNASLVIKALLQNVLSFRNVPDSVDRTYPLNWLDGVGDNQAQKVWAAQRTVATGATDDVDLFGVLTDAFGATFSPTKTKAVIIIAAGGNTTNLTVGAVGGATAFVGWFGANTHSEQVQPGGWSVHIAPKTGWTNAAGADILRIVNAAGASATYDIIVVG